MWTYEKKLAYPIQITTPNPAMARVIMSQLGGPDGELGAATRYLQQRYSMPYAQAKGMLTDIGTSVAIKVLLQLFFLFFSPKLIKASTIFVFGYIITIC